MNHINEILLEARQKRGGNFFWIPSRHVHFTQRWGLCFSVMDDHVGKKEIEFAFVGVV